MIREDCVTEKSEVLQYLGILQPIVFYNQNAFNQKEYGEQSIQQSSFITRSTADPSKPSWSGTYFDSWLLEDHSDYVQLTYTSDRYEFNRASFDPQKPSTRDKWPTE